MKHKHKFYPAHYALLNTVWCCECGDFKIVKNKEEVVK